MARSRSTASLFDRWSASYDLPGLQMLTYRPIHDAVLGTLRGLEPSMVIDLGCGTGQLTERLIHRFPDATVIGVDLSEGMLSEAVGRVGATGSRRLLVRADAHQLPFARVSVDLIVCTESFHWYRDQAGALDELAAVLRPGGRLLIASIATVTGLGDRLLRASSRAGGNVVRARPPSDVRRLLDRSGFDVVHQRRVPRLGPVAWPVLTDASRR